MPHFVANQLVPVVSRCHSSRTNAWIAKPMSFRSAFAIRVWQRSNRRVLLQAAMVLIDPPRLLGQPQPRGLVHCQVAGDPVFRVAVPGNDPG